MAQIDDYILDTLLRDLTGHDRRPAAFLVYLWLVGEQARRKESVCVSYQELAENTGLSRSSVQASVRWLVGRKLLASSKVNATAVPSYKVLFPWRQRAAAGR
jgi:predicted transcriptional regulator